MAPRQMKMPARLSLMRDIVWLPQIVSFLSLPLLSSLKAVE